MSETAVPSVTPTTTESAPVEKAPEVISKEPSVETSVENKQEAAPDLSKAEKKEIENAIKKFKVTIDGESMEVDETELVRNYQLRKASDRKFKEAADLRKQSDALIDLLKNDPIKALEHPSIGLRFREVAEKYLAEQLEEELMSPEEKERVKEKKAYQAALAENERFKKEKEEAVLQELTQKHSIDLQNKIVKALDGSGIPKTNRTVGRMAHYLKQALEHGYELEPKDLTELVKKDYQADIKELLGSSNEETLLELLGNEIAEKIRRHDVSKFKKEAAQIKTQQNQDVVPEKKEKPKKTIDEILNEIKSGLN